MNFSECIEKIADIDILIIEAEEEKERALTATEKSHNKERTDNAYNNYINHKSSVEQLTEERLQLVIFLSSKIDNIDNSIYRRILKKKYIDMKTIETIANDLHYSRGYTFALFAKAKQEIQKQFENE